MTELFGNDYEIYLYKQITLLSLNIYKHACDKYKQTNNCVYEKEQTQ